MKSKIVETYTSEVFMQYVVQTDIKFDKYELEIEIHFQYDKGQLGGMTDYEYIPYIPEEYTILSVNVINRGKSYPADWIIDELGEERLIELIQAADD